MKLDLFPLRGGVILDFMVKNLWPSAPILEGGVAEWSRHWTLDR